MENSWQLEREETHWGMFDESRYYRLIRGALVIRKADGNVVTAQHVPELHKRNQTRPTRNSLHLPATRVQMWDLASILWRSKWRSLEIRSP